MSGVVKVGIVKQVISGDTVVVRDAPRGGPPKELTLYLSGISAPKLAKRPTTNIEETKDEPYAWEAREFLRKKLIGENIGFVTEKPANAARDYSVIYLGKDTPNEENINETLVKEGLVTVRSPPGTKLRELEEQAKSAGKGKHNKNSKDEDHIRDVKWNISSETLQGLIDKYQGKSVKAIIEHVRDGSTVRCFIQDDNTFYYITLMMSGIRCPGFRMEDGKAGDSLAEQARFFVESRLLQRNVEITLDSISVANVVGSIIHPRGNIAEFLLQEGFAKCVDWTMKFVKNAETLRKCEKIAKEKRIRSWKDWQPTTPQLSGTDKEYQATVVEVGNGDTLMVKLPNGKLEKINLSNIRPPRLTEENKDAPRPKSLRPLYDIPWMFEAREFLRKKLIGKKVNVVVDYIQPATENFPKKTFCTVTIAGINVAEAMVLKGLATVVKHRTEDDQRSSHFDSLTAAEAKANKNQKGLHSKKDTPVHRINDYSSDSQKAKAIFPHLKRSSARTEALVEFVFSGSRLRLFIAKDSCLITLLLAGISCPRAPRQNPGGNVPVEGEPYGQEALNFTKERCFQREVEICLENVDKAGNFIGWLWVDNVNLSVALVQEGLSEVHFSAERSEHFRALTDAQDAAKRKKLNMWKNFVEEDDKDKHKDEEDMVTERKINYQKVVVIEITDELHIFTQIEEQCSKLEAMLAKLRQELANVTIGAYTPKRGEWCAAKFAGDGQWYRAKIEKVTGNKVKVFYVDYGNRDEILSTSCAALPAGFSADKPYASEYGLAFVKFGGDGEDHEQAINVLRVDLLNKTVLLNVEYRVNSLLHVTLCDPESNDNRDLVKGIVEDGYLLVEKRNDKRLLKVVEEYKAAEEKARKDRKALWRYGDITEDDDKEFGLGR